MKGIVTAIEFGSSKVACLTGIKRSFGRFELLFVTSCPYAGFRKKNWLQNDAIGYAVSEAIRKTKDELDTKISSAYFGIPGEFIQVNRISARLDITTPSGRISENDLAELEKQVTAQEKPDKMTSLARYTGYYLIDDKEPVRYPLGNKAANVSCEHIELYTDNGFIENIRSICDAIDIQINGFPCVPQAVAMLVSEEQALDYEIIVDIGYYVTDITIAYGAKLIFHKTLEVGGYHLANDIALCLNVPVDEAEYIKRKMAIDTSLRVLPAMEEEMVHFQPESGGSAQDIMMARLDEICILVGQAIRQANVPLRRGTKVHLTGGGVSMVEGVERYFHQRLNRPVKILDTGIEKADAPCYAAALATLYHSFMIEDKVTRI